MILTGKFGALSETQSEWFLSLARAYRMAPRHSWSGPKLREVIQSECERWGLDFGDVVWGPHELAQLEPISDEIAQ